MEVAFGASIVLSLVFLASVVSVEVGISVAVVEIIAGIIAGNYPSIHSVQLMDIIGGRKNDERTEHPGNIRVTP